ncbi:MAG TPA: crosslink repair DNA glycosylase YcaQ family protein, partial [Candidatus Binatia bacterium]|nr:crosslink repair DNA glycosylase YcaQ family protein [Candidatus Binatia bacterium]
MSPTRATAAPSAAREPMPTTRHSPVVRHVSQATARRFLVLRHFLTPPRSLPPGPDSVLRVVERFGSLQFDPLEVAGRNHDLVLLSRVAGYRREWTDELLYERRVLFEAYNKGLSILPIAELPWHRYTWDRARAEHEGGAFDEHAPLVEELLARIRTDGRLSSTDIESRASIEWYWGPTNPVRAMLEALAEAGIIGIARRDGNRRIYDLIERLYPAELLAVRPSEREQRMHRLLSRYRGHGMLGLNGQGVLFLALGGAQDRPEQRAELIDRGELVRVAIDGVRGERLIVGAEIPILEAAAAEVAAGSPPGGAAPGVAFLAPLDPLAW